MSGNFVHLHCHSEFSLLDGAARLGDMVERAAALGMPAVALTDHGNMFGAYEFSRKARAVGVKPIVGLEAYVAPSTSHRTAHEKVLYGEGGEDDVSGGGAFHHLTLLARNETGLRNLMKLSSLSYLEGHYRRPRMDMELFAQYGDGLIATTGCPSGEVQTRIRRGEYDLARKHAAELQDVFGFDNVYLELMEHGLDMESRARGDLLRLAKDLHLPLVATNDSHYVAEEDAGAHDALLAVQVSKTLSDPTRFRFSGTGYYLKSAAEMYEVFAELPDACKNTLVIAERCDTSFTEGANLMPKFAVPGNETAEKFLRRTARLGLQRRYKGSQENVARLEYELGVICDMGFPDYFLVTADFIAWAKERGIRVGPGRGSAAGSIVAYCLGITDIDPIQHGLMFERFLNPDRVTMPDVDIDFDEDRRDEVIDYVKRKYGEANVAQIVTYGSIGARAAVKDAARVLDMPYSLGEKLNNAMPRLVMGKPMSLVEIFDEDHPRYREGREFRGFYDNESDSRAVINTARGLEGLKRSSGVHAAGVLISEVPLIDVIPLQMRPKDGAVISQFDMGACEALGLVKMDFLGLRNLTIIEDCLANIRRSRNEDVVLEALSLDDTATYSLLASGETLGVFQLDGGPMRDLLRAMRPTSFEDVSAVIALYRPGPMGVDAHTDYAERKNGRQGVSAIHPELVGKIDDILDETYGLIVYQEQVMAIAQRVAGYTLAQADVLRRAMGKKKREVLDKEFIPFSAGMAAQGFSEGCVQTLWDILVPFSDYAFNKAHSAAYGLISYWTAYLKANYTSEYMAALLTSVGDDKDKSAIYLAECNRLGIPVLAPDVNVSAVQYTPHQGVIRFGLAAIRNVGEGVVNEIVLGRSDQDGRPDQEPYTSFANFLARHPLGQVRNKKTVESLVKAGAFDSLGQTRRELLILLEAFLGNSGASLALSGADRVKSARKEMPQRVLLTFEKEMLGLTVSNRKQEAPRITAVVVHIPAENCTEERLAALGRAIAGAPGETEVRLHVQSAAGFTPLRLPTTVTPSDELIHELAALAAA